MVLQWLLGAWGTINGGPSFYLAKLHEEDNQDDFDGSFKSYSDVKSRQAPNKCKIGGELPGFIGLGRCEESDVATIFVKIYFAKPADMSNVDAVSLVAGY